MKPGILYNLVSHFFMALFIYTGLSKLFDIKSFKSDIESLPLLTSLAGVISWILPITELIIVIFLFIPKTRLKGLYASLVLMFLFTFYLVGLLFLNNHVSCNCGGIVANLKPVQHLLFNSICIVLAILGICSAKNVDPNPTKIKWLPASLTLLMFSYIGWALLTAATAPTITKTGKEGSLLPSFNILLLDSSTLNTGNIPGGSPFIMIGFSPFCPHCKGEISDIIHNKAKFKNTHIYLISTFRLPELRRFNERFSLANYPNITIGTDDHNAFLSYFQWHSIPFTTIYDSRKRLAQAIAGHVGISTLSQCINN